MKQGDWVVPCAAASPILACSFRFASHQQNNEPPRSTGACTSALSPNLTRRMEMTLHRTLRYTLAFALLGPPAAAGGPSSAKARVYRNVRCNVISILLVRFGDRADVRAPVERGGSLFCWWDAKRNEHGQYRRCGRAWHYPIPLLRTWPRRSTILSCTLFELPAQSSSRMTAP